MASLHGRAKRLNSLINQTNTCGGDKKSGIPSTIGPVSNRNSMQCKNTCYVVPTTCVIPLNKFLFNYRPNTKYLG
jgi:hypothetical protein